MHTQAIDFHPPTQPAETFLLPQTASVFAERAARFEQLAHNHKLEAWLLFLAQVSRAQQAALARHHDLEAPSAEQLARAAQHGMPPLDSSRAPIIWQTILKEIIEALDVDATANPSLSASLAQLASADSTALDRLAALLFEGEASAEDLSLLPFVAAALQVVLTAQAAVLDRQQLQKLDAHTVCPCCGSPAVASVLRLGSEINNLRYLHCSLCNTEWNVTRAICTSCGSDEGIALHEAEGLNAPVRAETCDRCQHYMKQIYQEKNPHVDPIADDLASLHLDLLLDEAAYQRAGLNFFLIGAN